MDFEKSKVEKLIDLGKYHFSRSKILGRLLFRTARMENERRKILQQIGQFYCDKFHGSQDKSSFPSELTALFSRHAEITHQLKSHYDELDRQPPPPTTPSGSAGSATH